MHGNFGALTNWVGNAREAARREARRDYRVVRSRGTWLATAGVGGDQVYPAPEAECPTWDGTKREILALVARVEREFPTVDKVYLAGGYDGADSVVALNEGWDYEPWVSTWSVDVWSRSGGWEFDLGAPLSPLVGTVSA